MTAITLLDHSCRLSGESCLVDGNWHVNKVVREMEGGEITIIPGL